MTETISVQDYYISFHDDSFEISMEYDESEEKIYTKAHIIAILVMCLMLLPFLAMSIFSFVYHSPAHGVIFLFLFLSGEFLEIWLGIMQMKQQKCYRFILNEQGITQIQVNKTYFIPWNEISSYGFVGDVKGQVKYSNESNHDTYLIASKKIFSEKKLRANLSLGKLGTYAHCSSDDLIAVVFEQKYLDEELKSRMLAYFHRYMGEDVESYD